MAWWNKNTPENRKRQQEGKLPVGVWLKGNKLMTKCPDCGEKVRVNKPIFGDLHVCVS